MKQQEFDRHLSKVSEAATNKSLKAAAIELLAAMGYPRWIYASENPFSTMGVPVTLANGYGTWILIYLAKGYQQVDPIVAHCRNSTEPYFWDTSTGWDKHNKKISAMMNDAADHGFGSGLTIPLRLPGEPQCLLNVTSSDPLASSRAQLEAALPQLRQFGITMHTAMMKILKDNTK